MAVAATAAFPAAELKRSVVQREKIVGQALPPADSRSASEALALQFYRRKRRQLQLRLTGLDTIDRDCAAVRRQRKCDRPGHGEQ
jgi:hypothetical protein